MLRTVTATRYVTPLREGGSLPALVEADDDGLYVVKLLGAGHGRKALVAELLAGEIARHLGLPVPDQVLVELDGALAKAEPNREIQELLGAVGGNEHRARLPARRARLRLQRRSPARPGPRRVDRLVRRLRHQRRPDAAQPQPHRVAPAAAPDRPRVRAVHPPHVARSPRARAAPVRADPGPRPAAVRVVHRRRRCPPVPAGHAIAGRGAGGRDPRRLAAAPRTAWPAPDDHRRAYVDYLMTRLEAPRAFVEEAERARAA